VCPTCSFVDQSDMRRMYQCIGGGDTTDGVAQLQVARADANGDGLLSREEFVSFSLPVFSAVDFVAACHLLECFTATCTVVVASEADQARAEYQRRKQRLLDELRTRIKLYECDPAERREVDKKFRDLAGYRCARRRDGGGVRECERVREREREVDGGGEGEREGEGE
jgi:hypothetical protein